MTSWLCCYYTPVENSHVALNITVVEGLKTIAQLDKDIARFNACFASYDTIDEYKAIYTSMVQNNLKLKNLKERLVQLNNTELSAEVNNFITQIDTINKKLDTLNEAININCMTLDQCKANLGKVIGV